MIFHVFRNMISKVTHLYVLQKFLHSFKAFFCFCVSDILLILRKD